MKANMFIKYYHILSLLNHLSFTHVLYHFIEVIVSHYLLKTSFYKLRMVSSYGKDYESSNFDVLIFITMQSQVITLVLERF